jgi:hypothetical protein
MRKREQKNGRKCKRKGKKMKDKKNLTIKK